MSSRENANDTNQVVIVDLSDANNVIRRPSKLSAHISKNELMGSYRRFGNYAS